MRLTATHIRNLYAAVENGTKEVEVYTDEGGRLRFAEVVVVEQLKTIRMTPKWAQKDEQDD